MEPTVSSRANTMRAVKGYLRYSAIVYRKTLINFALILGGLLFVLMFLGAAFTASVEGGAGSTNGGALSGGVLVAIIYIGIMGFSDCSSSEMSRIFAFPVNRKAYFMGNLLVVPAVAFAFTYVIAIASGFEVLLGRILTRFVSHMALYNTISVEHWILGFWITGSYLVFIMSMAYLAGMYYYRFRLSTIVVGAVVLASFLVMPWRFEPLMRILMFYSHESNAVMLTLKLWGSALVAHVLTLVPLIRLEVRS